MTPYWQSADGRLQIFHGDCREIVAGFDASRVDLLLTDPPYGIRSVKPDGKMGGQPASGRVLGPTPNRVYLQVHDDDKPLDPTWLLSIGKRQMIWGADHFVGGTPPGGRMLVWDKRDGIASNDLADLEVAWDSKVGPSRLLHHRQMGMLHDGYGDIGRIHPNQKPLNVMRWCLQQAPEARLILDLFMGSGTTLVAARGLNRAAIGIEIEERYCEIAARRLEDPPLLAAMNAPEQSALFSEVS